MSKRIKEFLSVLPGVPIGATVVDGNVNYAIQTWKRKFKDSGLIKDLYANQEFVKPSVKRRKQILSAIYMNKKGRPNV